MRKQSETDSFIEEIKEDLKNDNLKKLWDKFGVYVIAIIAGIILFTICIEGYKAWQVKKNQDLLNVYTYALNLEAQKKYDESLTVFEQFSSSNEFLKDMAQMEAVNVLFEKDKKEEAFAQLRKIIVNVDVDMAIRNLAVIKLASYNVDEVSFAQMQELLKPISEAPNAWQMTAKELLALSALKNNDKKQAVTLYEEIANNPNSVETLKVRALDMLSVLQ